MTRRLTFGGAVFLIALLASGSASAQGWIGRATGQPAGETATARPGLLAQIRIDQKLDAQVPLDLSFVDDEGKPVTLGQYFGKRPVVLALVYYECPMLCTQVLNGLATAIGVLSFDVGREFDVLAVSFDPRETPGLARAKKAAYVERYGRAGTEAGWHFLTGTQDAIARLTDAVGFRYAYDKETDQYAHAATIIVLTPEGRVSRYFYGIEYSARDLRLGLVEASQNRIGTAVDQALLLCYHYDPAEGKYGVAILNLMRVGAALTMVGLGVFLVVAFRQERRRGVL